MGSSASGHVYGSGCALTVLHENVRRVYCFPAKQHVLPIHACHFYDTSVVLRDVDVAGGFVYYPAFSIGGEFTDEGVGGRYSHGLEHDGVVGDLDFSDKVVGGFIELNYVGVVRETDEGFPRCAGDEGRVKRCEILFYC